MYKLLIVDDEPIIIRGIRSFVDFEKLHIEKVYEAQDGIEALEVFKEHHPDLVLVDINMPNMNGLDFAKKIKSINPKVKIGIVTGYDYFDYAVAALKIGVDDFMLKPVSKHDIYEGLKKLITKLQGDLYNEEVKTVLSDLKTLTDGQEDSDYKATIQKLIDEHIMKNYFSLSFLGEEINLSTGYLSVLFKQLYGVPFQEYVLSRRLESAKILLLSTQMKIYEIAEAIGIEDSNYFSAAFKKKFNLSPNQYKEKARE